MAVVQFFRTHENAKLPYKASAGSSGWDLYSVEEIELPPNEPVLVDTGWKIAIPRNYEGQVRPRSGLALKQKITVLNSPGTIDADYRGPLKVILMKQSNGGITRIPAGTRIAQMVVQEVPLVALAEVSSEEDLGVTGRGEGGFGSTGTE